MNSGTWGRAASILAFMVASGCSGKDTGTSGGGAGDPTVGEPGAGADAGYTTYCVPDDGVYDCLGASWSVCPSSARAEQPCSSDPASCMGCRAGAGYVCICEDAGFVPGSDAGPEWYCIAAGSTCQ